VAENGRAFADEVPVTISLAEERQNHDCHPKAEQQFHRLPDLKMNVAVPCTALSCGYNEF